MKIFEARYDNVDNVKEIVEIHEFVIADNLLQVTEFYTNFCYEYEFDLKLVREAVTAVRDIRVKQ